MLDASLSVYMTVYLYDERRWQKDDPSDYADFLHGSVTDVVVLVYGARKGGVIGWKSRLIDTAKPGKLQLLDFIKVMNKRGIRVHAAFQVCRVNRKSKFKAHSGRSKFVDVHNLKFQEFITNLMSECAALPVHGICMDYIRTDDYSDAEKNDVSIESIVRQAYQKIKLVNHKCIVSSTTAPYKDINHPQLLKTGRKAIRWANNGYHDILFDMKYGGPKGKAGDPPDMGQVYEARKLTNVPIVAMIASYKKDVDGKPMPTDAAQFARVLNSVIDEDDIAIYTGWLFTEEQALLVEQMYGY